MKRMVLCFALLLMSFSAFAQSYGPVRDLGYRNEFFITPSAFFDGTFALGYQRNFETFALSHAVHYVNGGLRVSFRR